MSNRRWIVAGTAIAIVAAAVLFLQSRGTNQAPILDDSPPTQQQAAEQAPDTPETDSAKTPSRNEAANAAAAFAPRAPVRETAGRGRIYGKAALPADAPKGLPITIALHAVDIESPEVSYDENRVGTTQAAADGSYEFTELKVGRYVLFASATGFTMNGGGLISADRLEDETNLNLVPGGDLSGRVLNEQGQPVDGAHVFNAGWDIQGSKQFAPRDRALASQRITDADGRFTMNNFRKSLAGEPGYRLAVKAEGYATLISDYFQAGTQGIELVLHPGEIVSGILLHAKTGEPVPDKTVALDSELAVESITAQTDPGGFFFLNDVAPGIHTASLRDDELVITPESSKFNVASEGATDEVILHAITGGRITGRVYDRDTGAGIAGVTLYASSSVLSSRKEVTTTTDGQYQLAGLKSGQYRVSFRKPKGYPQPRNNEDERQVTADADRETTGVDFPISRGILIMGKAVDEEGNPVEGASVSGNANRSNAYDSDQSAADGSFVLAGFSPHQEVRLWARKPETAVIGTDPAGGVVKVEDENVTGVRVVFGVQATLSGTVVNKAGQPQSAVEVYARRVDSDFGFGSNARSGSDGSIRFQGLTEGEYYFIFPRDGMYRDDGGGNAQHFTIARAQELKGVRIVVPETNEGELTISGRVTDPKGNPLPNVDVQTQSRRETNTRTNASGEYELKGLTEGTYHVLAVSYAHSAAPGVQVPAGSRNVNFVLKGLATIEGRVVSAVTGQPVTTFRVRFRGGGQQYYVRDQFISVNDADGRFSLTNVEDGATALDVRAEGFADTLQPLTGVVGGETLHDILVRMQDGIELAGRVLDASRSPVRGAQLFVGGVPQEYRRSEELRTMSTDDGSFLISSLPAGEVQISASHPEFASKSITVHLSPGRLNRQDIVLTSGATVEGRVLVNGQPFGSPYVHINRGNDYQSTQADSEGRYRFTGLPDGQVNISANVSTGKGNRSKNEKIDVADGLVYEIDFDFLEGTSVIEGTVYAAENQPLRGQAWINAQVQAPDGSTENYGSELRDNGSYRLEGLVAGQATVRVYSQTAGQKSIRLNVGENQRILKDIHLYGGSALLVSVSGNRPENNQLIVTLLAGSPAIGVMSIQTYQELQEYFVSSLPATDGSARLTNLDPGDYTVLVIALNRTGAGNGGDPFAAAQWAAQAVTIGDAPESQVRVQL